MFSRAAKSMVQHVNYHQCHFGKRNFQSVTGSTDIGNHQKIVKAGSTLAYKVLPFKNLKFKNITSPEQRSISSGTSIRNVDLVSLKQKHGHAILFGNFSVIKKVLSTSKDVEKTILWRKFSTISQTLKTWNSPIDLPRYYSKESKKSDNKGSSPCKKDSGGGCGQKSKCPPPCPPPVPKCPPPPCPPPPKCPPPPCPPPKCPPPSCPCPAPPPKCPTPCNASTHPTKCQPPAQAKCSPCPPPPCPSIPCPPPCCAPASPPPKITSPCNQTCPKPCLPPKCPPSCVLSSATKPPPVSKTCGTSCPCPPSPPPCPQPPMPACVPPDVSQLKKQSSCNPGCCPPATCGSSNKKTEPPNKKPDTKKSVEPKKTATAPPQPASAPQPPVAATPTEAGSGKKKKKKGLWARLTRKMSTLGNSSMTKGTYPSFVVPMKTFGHSTVHYKAKKTPPTKPSDRKTLKSTTEGCKQPPCSSNTCVGRPEIVKPIQEQPKEKKKPVVRGKCSAEKKPSQILEKQEYPPVSCPKSLTCPSYADKTDVKIKPVVPPPVPLPKPPSSPVVLCPCSPPPTLPPGPCPCLTSVNEVKLLIPLSSVPCVKKPKYQKCKRKSYWCPPMKNCGESGKCAAK